jgi:hypothetical protein
MLKRWLQAGRRPAKEDVSGSSGALRNFWSNFTPFELRDSIVCCVWTNEGSFPDRNLKVVSTSWRKIILEGNHEELGHIGTTKRKLALRKSFYWFGMLADVDVWVKACKVCRRRLPGNSRAPLVQEADSFFNQWVFIDLKGPLVESRRGNNWYLVAIDGWSKWTELLPLEDEEVTTVHSIMAGSVTTACSSSCTVTRGPTWSRQ